ncbi:MAG: pirin family protein [Brucellaceae bacterium]|nr:pirin family protein [Brucellaceae bacterium]
MSFFPSPDPRPGDAASCDAVETLIIPGARELGGLPIRRALPSARRRLVGPFIFFDRMGPALLRAGEALDIRPHPHIGLSTVTYLFDGSIRHRDSLGSQMVIRPGDVNLMTAGRGIVHSERTPEESRGAPMSVSGLQTWLALPDAMEEIAPAFATTAKADLPELEAGGVHARVVIGSFHGATAPVMQHHETLYVDVRFDPGAVLEVPAETEERALYVLSGTVTISGDEFGENNLLVLRPGDPIEVESADGAHVMLFGGAAIPTKRYIWWNFVSSSRERIEQAKEEWKTGRFDIVPGDTEEFVPLPE